MLQSRSWFLGGGYRQHHFKLAGLREVERELAQYQIPFMIVIGDDSDPLSDVVRDLDIGVVVTDFFPLTQTQEWVHDLAQKIHVPLYEVDAHNIVPVWQTSTKQEYAARTIRPKLHKLLPEFLTPFPKLHKQSHAASRIPEMYVPDWEALENTPHINRNIEPVSWIVPGASAAHRALESFLKERFGDYGGERNNPLVRGQSDLSPYLHYGHISAQTIALAVLAVTKLSISDILSADRNGAATDNSAAAFLEELIIRKELSDNFCYYQPAYATSLAFPEWAQKTLLAAADDAREYVYTLAEFEGAQTHDDLWNAAQREMVITGKMHGYMRMYWAKKILEWTTNPDEALRIAIYLNDAYELDGRDPNGYAGIAWSIGGVHDRPWFCRPVFGTIRYMARSGCAKKFDVDAYIEKWSQGSSLFTAT